MALINKLNAIGDAIREKTGKTDLLTLDEMPIEIAAIETGGGDSGIPEEALVITGNCTYKFSNDGWNWFIKEYGNKITTKDITNMANMFYYSKILEEIPFDLNVTKDCKKMNWVFGYCMKIKEAPLIKGDLSAPTGNYSGTLDLSNLFSSCNYLRYIPEDYFRNFGGDAFWEASKLYKGARDNIFFGCYSLRQAPDISMLKITDTSIYSSLYYSLFQNCYALDEAINIPVLDTCNYTSNALTNTFYYCHRLKRITFETNEDGTPIAVKWRGQSIYLSNYLGYAYRNTHIENYNSGISSLEIPNVTDDDLYQLYKDNPDYWTTKPEYSRYNHDSAVETINSLPDASAYLATAGGVNGIQFEGKCGEKTDGGAINTLTEAEIAVAAAKGWTVSFK